MNGRTVRPWALALALVAVLAAAGCGDADSTTGSGPDRVLTQPPLPSQTTAAPRTSSADQGPVYAPSGSLCERADLASLAELFPKAETPLANTARLCDTSRSSESMVVTLSIDAELLKDGRWAKEFFDTARRRAKTAPTDVPAAGAGAFWTGDERTVELFSYHGNLVLQIRLHALRDQDRLPADTPDRLARVAAGTFARLAP
ncbi:hypothetical protein ACIBF5_19560 [Micromonospora sp. NPDC050417]|uniref:hypothetical protein n=1 Tax=Micromonospora sp. NPDC050417 TaxID=3364280 RepID=UPI00378F0A2E